MRNGELKDVNARAQLQKPFESCQAGDTSEDTITKKLVLLFLTANYYASFADDGRFHNVIADDLSFGNHRVVGVVLKYFIEAREAYCADKNHPVIPPTASALNQTLCSLVDEFGSSRNRYRHRWTSARKQYVASVRATWRDAVRQGLHELLRQRPEVPHPGLNPDWLRRSGPETSNRHASFNGPAPPSSSTRGIQHGQTAAMVAHSVPAALAPAPVPVAPSGMLPTSTWAISDSVEQAEIDATRQ
jgi:hypothetical protein